MRWLPKVLTRVPELAAAGRVRLTHKALIEAAELDCDATDVVAVLRGLDRSDSAGRVRSPAVGEWLYVWKPRLGGTSVYLKVALRSDCIVVSFHEDEAGDEGDD